jgi:hypothetical protein
MTTANQPHSLDGRIPLVFDTGDHRPAASDVRGWADMI